MSEATIYRHAELATVDRAAVLEAIRECDRVGMHAFLETHGYRPSLRYQLRHKGRSYPSKAVLGVAAGLESSEFFGGAAVVVRHLLRLGFQVREGRRVVTELGLLELARAERGGGPDVFGLPELPAEPAAWFASGSNRAGEIRGLGIVGQDVGVAAPEILGRAPAEAALLELAGSDVQVFVDSGAFSEVEFTAQGAFERHTGYDEKLGLSELGYPSQRDAVRALRRKFRGESVVLRTDGGKVVKL